MVAARDEEWDEESGRAVVFVTPAEQGAMPFEEFVECCCASCRGCIVEVPLEGYQTAEIHLGWGRRSHRVLETLRAERKIARSMRIIADRKYL